MNKDYLEKSFFDILTDKIRRRVVQLAGSVKNVKINAVYRIFGGTGIEKPGEPVICRLFLDLITILFFIGAVAAPSADAAKLVREGQATYTDLDYAKPPQGTSAQLFSSEISCASFDLFVRSLDPQPLTIELGFVDIESGDSGQHTFALAVNGTPLDANLDVWAKAGGAFKPWVMKATVNHAGGALSLQFSGLNNPAFVSYVRISKVNGEELAFGTTENWKMAERLTLLDSRFRPFQRVKVGDVPFFDADHSPVGSWSTFIYGMAASGGVQVDKQFGGDGTLIPQQGVIIAVKSGKNERVMPFASNQKSLPEGALITDRETESTAGRSRLQSAGLHPTPLAEPIHSRMFYMIPLFSILTESLRKIQNHPFGRL